MTCRISFKISKKFGRVLAQINHNKISRNHLINIAIKEIKLSRIQATGLVDRGVHQLKMQGLVISSGSIKNIIYKFSSEVTNPSLFHQANDGNCMLSSEKKALEKDLLLIRYELQAYRELLEKIPQEKLKITKLQKDTAEKFNQLNGTIRAINQLLSM